MTAETKMRNKHLIIQKAGILALALVFALAGCGQRSQKPAPQPQQQSAEGGQAQDKAPDQLSDIEDNIEKIFKAYNAPTVMTKEEGDKEGGQAGKGAQEKQTQGGSDKKDEKSGSAQGEGQQKSQPQPTPQQDPADKTMSIISTLHYQWNSYMPMAAKSGASKSLIDNFSNSLNNLTNTVGTRNRTNILLAANGLYAYLPDFYNLYKTKNSPEIKRVRYFTRSVMLNSVISNWTQADTDMNNLKASWSLYKNTLDKEQQEVSSKLDFSIYELEKVVKDKNQQLVDIKGRVTISNIELLEKATQSGSAQGGQGGQSSGGTSGGQAGGSSGGGTGSSGSSTR